MKPRILARLVALTALLAFAGFAKTTSAPSALPASDEAVTRTVAHEILTYPHYGIWDYVDFQVSGGRVLLTGEVTQPYKRSDLLRLVEQIPGVTEVTNQLEVLPLSDLDYRLRAQVARAIYSDPSLSRYAVQAIPPIHVIVNNGRVTLEGVVNNPLEKQIAGLRADAAGLSFGPIVNNLRVENPANRG